MTEATQPRPRALTHAGTPRSQERDDLSRNRAPMATWSAKRNGPSRFVGDVDVGSYSSWWFSPAARRGADIRSLRPPIRYKFESRGSGPPARPQIPAAAVTARPHTWPGSAFPCATARVPVYATYVPFRGVSQSVFKKLFIHVILYPARGRAIRHPRLSAASRSCRYASGMPLTVLTRRRRARARSGIRLVFVRLLSLFSLTSTHLCAC